MPSVLIVDDSRMSRLLVEAIVREVFPDAEIVEAEDGDDALTKLGDKPLDFATVDLNMPGIDAFDLVEALRHHSPGIKLGLLTAHVQDEVQAKAERLGVKFIPKPIEQENITDFLLELEPFGQAQDQ